VFGARQRAIRALMDAVGLSEIAAGAWAFGLDPIVQAPPVRSVVRPAEGEGRGFLSPLPKASEPTSVVPVVPPDLNRTIRNHRFHGCHVSR
jgi:hypothetical protein